MKFDPWVEKIPWSRKWQPLPVFLPRKSHWQRSLAGYSPWDHRVRYDWACMHAVRTTRETDLWVPPGCRWRRTEPWTWEKVLVWQGVQAGDQKNFPASGVLGEEQSQRWSCDSFKCLVFSLTFFFSVVQIHNFWKSWKNQMKRKEQNKRDVLL